MKYNIRGYWDEGSPNNETIQHPVFLIEFYQINNSKYGNISVRPVYIKTLSNGEQSFEFYSNHSNGENILYWFQIQAQFDWITSDIEDRKPYAIKTGYNDDEAMTIENIESLDSKRNFLRKIEKSLNKAYSEYGSPESFGEYVLRVANAMGIKFFIVKTSPDYFNPTFRWIEKRDVKRLVNEIPVQHKFVA